MDVREKLVELIRKGARGHTLMPTESIANYLVEHGVTVQDNTQITDEFLEQLRNTPVTILQEEPTIELVQEWTSVKDRLPKKRGHYFIAYRFMGDGADMQFFGEAMWHDDIPDNGYVKGNHFSNEGVDGMYVTHWMEIPPLPQPPKGE